MAALDDILRKTAQGYAGGGPGDLAAPTQPAQPNSAMSDALERARQSYAQPDAGAPTAAMLSAPGVADNIGSGIMNFAGGAANAFNDNVAKMGEGVLSVNHAAANGLRSLFGMEHGATDGTGAVQGMRDQLGRLPQDGMSGAAGNVIGSMSADGVAGALALGGLTKGISAMSRLPAVWRSVADFVGSAGMQTPIRAQISKQLLEKAALPGAAPIGRAATSALQQQIPGMLERMGGGAAAGVIAGAAPQIGDMRDMRNAGLVGGAAGAVGPPLAAAGRWAFNKADDLRAMLKMDPQDAQDAADAVFRRAYGGPSGTQDTLKNTQAVLAKVRAAAKDIAPSRVIDQADDANTSVLYRMAKSRNPNVAALDDVQRSQASTTLSRKLEAGSAGLERDIAARTKAMEPLEKVLDGADVDTAQIRAAYDDIMGRNAGDLSTSGAIKDTSRALTLGGGVARTADDIPEQLSLRQVYNARKSKNQVVAGDFTTDASRALGSKKLPEHAQTELGKLGAALRESMHALPDGKGIAVQQLDDVFKKLSVPINQKRVMRDIFDKAQVSGVTNEGAPIISGPALKREIAKAARKRKVWSQLTSEQKDFLYGTQRELIRNARSELKGSLQGSNTAQALEMRVLPPQMKRALDSASSVPQSGGMLNSLRQAVTNRRATQVDQVLGNVAQRMSEPGQFMEMLQRIIADEQIGKLPAGYAARFIHQNRGVLPGGVPAALGGAVAQ